MAKDKDGQYSGAEFARHKIALQGCADGPRCYRRGSGDLGICGKARERKATTHTQNTPVETAFLLIEGHRVERGGALRATFGLG
jgi:hypothetical protein